MFSFIVITEYILVLNNCMHQVDLSRDIAFSNYIVGGYRDEKLFF